MQRSLIVKIFLGILVSFYLFPITFTFFKAANTKMMLAVFGAAVFAMKSLRHHSEVKKHVMIIFGIALAFSMLCFLSALLNSTDDYSYAKYFLTFLAWTFGAYSICFFLKKRYGCVSLRTVVLYLAVVCAAQCILAQLIDHFEGFKTFIDGIISQDQENLNQINRLYGIGAYLDPAGVRFAFTLVLISYFIGDNIENEVRRGELIMFITAFIIITVFGNMISRTTTVGALLGLGYILIVRMRTWRLNVKTSTIGTIALVFSLLGAAGFILVYYYNQDTVFHDNMRFAFEGFFNWLESGEFRTDSTDKLNNNMWIWPKDTETWIFGTGLFGNWAFGTDVGYCRFILYCGLLGFGMFVFYFIYCAVSLSRYYENFKLTALLIFSITLIIWVKVSTDIFQIYILLLLTDGIIRDPLEEEEEGEEIAGTSDKIPEK